MKKTTLLFMSLLTSFCSMIGLANDVVIHSNTGSGLELVNIDPPQVTYDDELNELYVYFGSTGTIDLEYVDGTGIPYYYIYGESHVGYTSTSYTGLPAGYYTITIHSVYGYTYYGNFSVS